MTIFLGLLALALADPCAQLPASYKGVYATGPSPQGLNGSWNFIEKTVKTSSACPPFWGQLLLKVEAASVNPVDYNIALHHGGALGMDVSGVVVAVGKGEGCAEFKIGDQVYGDTRSGSYAEYAWAPCGKVGRRSASSPMTLADYASLPIAAGTSLEALWDAGAPWRRTAGKNLTVVITSGAGGTGVFGIMQAVALGAGRVITAARAEHAPMLKRLGATEVVDYTVHSLWDFLPAESVDVVYDNYGAPGTADLAMACLKSANSGGNSTFIFLPGKSGGLSKHPKPGVRQVDYGLFTSSPSTYAALSAMLDAKTVGPVITGRYALSAQNVEAAFRRQAAGHVVGKLVFDVARSSPPSQLLVRHL